MGAPAAWLPISLSDRILANTNGGYCSGPAQNQQQAKYGQNRATA